MRRAEPTNRTIAAATTTLVALVAMAAVSPRAHGLAVARIAHGQVAVTDAPAVRAVAAAVRDLLASSHALATLPPADPTPVPPARPATPLTAPADEHPPIVARLGPRRLDLPPPIC